MMKTENFAGKKFLKREFLSKLMIGTNLIPSPKHTPSSAGG